MVGFDDPKSLLQPKQFYDSNQCQSAEMFLGSGHFMPRESRSRHIARQVFLNKEPYIVPGLVKSELQVCDHFSFLQREEECRYYFCLTSAPRFRNESVTAIKATSKKLVTAG